MGKRTNIYQVSGGKIEGKRPVRILRCRWKSVHFIHVAHDRN
jgi:hypothetical protein